MGMSLAVVLRCLIVMQLFWSGAAFAAIPVDQIRDLALGENDARMKAISATVAAGKPDAIVLLQAMLDGEVQTLNGTQVLRVQSDRAVDVVTGAEVTPLPEGLDDVVMNNRVRKELGVAIAALKLTSPDRTIRLNAVKGLQSAGDDELLPAISAALVKETDPEIKSMLSLIKASIEISSSDKIVRIAA